MELGARLGLGLSFDPKERRNGSLKTFSGFLHPIVNWRYLPGECLKSAWRKDTSQFPEPCMLI